MNSYTFNIQWQLFDTMEKKAHQKNWQKWKKVELEDHDGPISLTWVLSSTG